MTEQFPYALQSIQTKAGYHKSEHPHNFKYISLLEIPRKDRFSVLDEYLNLLKRETKNPLFIVLDVSCLLYTSDAADERSSVDLGGRRIIKKKKKKDEKRRG